MAVTKAQIAQWSAMEKQRQKAADEPMTKKQMTAAPVENERVSREQIRQWHAETAQKASGNVYADALDEYRANHNLGFASEMDSYRTGGAMARQSPAAKWGKPLSLADARQLPYQGSPWQAGQQHQTAQAVGNAEERALLPLAEGTGSIYGSLAQKQKQYND